MGRMAMPLFYHASAALSTPPRRVRVHLQLAHVSLRSEDFRRLRTGPVSWERLRAITACISLPIRCTKSPKAEFLGGLSVGPAVFEPMTYSCYALVQAAPA